MQTEKFYTWFEQYIDQFSIDSTFNEAIKYVYVSKGKLIRPKLFWAMLADLNIKDEFVELASAIEMIHTYSLVHDDLPAMDNDDYRRGRETCHIKYGEDIAILVGDALLTHAFGLIAEADISPEQTVMLLKAFRDAAGINGMIGGQVLDVKNENDPQVTSDLLEQIHDLKTAKMIELPIKCAMIVSGNISDEKLEAIRKLGLLYQIQDDYLDTYGDFEKTGKAVNSDDMKVTYTTLYSKEQVLVILNDLEHDIKKAFANCPNVLELINMILKREG